MTDRRISTLIYKVIIICTNFLFWRLFKYSFIDFGMAQHLRTGDSSEKFRGSPLYMVSIKIYDKHDHRVGL